MIYKRKMKAKWKYGDKILGRTPKYIEEFEYREDRYKKVLEIFSRYKLGKILDVGCGDGNFSILLKDACNAKEVYGVEILNTGVESARKNGVKVFQLDIDEGDFPFDDKYFDAVFAGEIIEHLYDIDHFLEECYRVLNNKGIFVLTTRNLSSLYNRITLLLGYQPFPMSISLKHRVGYAFGVSDEPPGDHIRVSTYRAIRELLYLYKFEISKVKGVTSVLPKNKSLFLSIVRLMDGVLSKFPSLSQGVIFVCQKGEKY